MPVAIEKIQELVNKIPLSIKKNALLRKRIINASKMEQEQWKALFSSGAEGCIAWITTCCWLYEPRKERDKRIPWLLWEVQSEAVRTIINAIQTQKDLAITKSRDMGVTWLVCCIYVWYFIFKEDSQFLVASRKEEYVDKRGDHKSLFWKIQYLLDSQCSWLKPSYERTYMHIFNKDNNSCIDGESTSHGQLARGDRRLSIYIDEFASVESSHAVKTATADATNCRLFVSTPQGRSGAFADIVFSGTTEVLTMHWSDCPSKGKGKERIIGADGIKKWSSPWYRAECERRQSKTEIAQELDIDFLASGSMYFDSEILSALRASGTLIPPKIQGELLFDVKTNREGKSYKLEVDRFQEKPSGLIKIWCDLVNNKLNQDTNYVAFCDISMGTGASNSVISFLDMNTREVVIEYATPYEAPHDFARYVVALCKWVGGQSNVFLGWEANGGGGEIFGREIIRLDYGPYYRDKTEDVAWRPEGKKFGWHSTRSKKSIFLGDLRASLAKQELIIHNKEVVSELEQYITFKDGSVGPSAIVEESSGARANHGDRVISIGGLVLLAGEYFKAKPEARKIDPIYSFEGRNKTYKANKKKKKDQW